MIEALRKALREVPRQAIATVFNTAVGADTNILASDVSPVYSPAIFRIMVALSASAIFRARITRDGTTVTVDFNAGATLTANALYAFDMPVRSGDAVNFRLSAPATVLVLNVDEIDVMGP